jgi:hypothetical protein
MHTFSFNCYMPHILLNVTLFTLCIAAALKHFSALSTPQKTTHRGAKRERIYAATNTVSSRNLATVYT